MIKFNSESEYDFEEVRKNWVPLWLPGTLNIRWFWTGIIVRRRLFSINITLKGKTLFGTSYYYNIGFIDK